MKPHIGRVTGAIALAIGVVLGGCAMRPSEVTPRAAADMPRSTTGPGAVATMKTAGGQVVGRATLTSVSGGVEILLDVGGLSPGAHGFHIHANGACAPGPDGDTGRIVDFGAAGGHFDPGNSRNHGAPGQPTNAAHAGELPNLEVRSDGRGTLRYLNANISVAAGPTSVIGRSLVVHANADDYATDPSGNSGPRVLCGVIEPR